ncbi:EamA family transporter [Blastococcus sp. VKM Ac-2987]|uniref:EamA family transporter n=1 Tax=Blastococcus sp. VKM Ac-2987 TaxID=3004141 RepID=UPI0022AB5B2A|nr:EamA family transporter [Blastococcus sp. VKM Ac-2987]MCZ2861261.1 EamA family transporter [Blastococcus sp. VKM Ac-2987]
MAVVLALASAVVYGASDFLGGLASRRASVFGVVALSQLAGLAALLVLLPWLGGPSTSADLAWGAAAGLAGAAGLLVFFRALAGGVMSVIAPVTAVTAAAVPVLVGMLGGERVGPWALAGIVLALVAVVLVSAEAGLAALRAARPASLLPALVAGAAFGLFFVLLDRTSQDAGLTPLVTARLASVALVAAVAVSTRQSLRAGRTALPLVVVSGIGDMTGNSLFLLATQEGGQLAVTGVLASLYPVSTVLLAQLLLRERLVPAQLAGLLAAAAAVVLITMPG